MAREYDQPAALQRVHEKIGAAILTIGLADAHRDEIRGLLEDARADLSVLISDYEED